MKCYFHASTALLLLNYYGYHQLRPPFLPVLLMLPSLLLPLRNTSTTFSNNTNKLFGINSVYHIIVLPWCGWPLCTAVTVLLLLAVVRTAIGHSTTV
jgi:hypothetical protein